MMAGCELRTMADFLFEIGLEEVPARMIAEAQTELQERVVKMLERERLVRSGVDVKTFATPRRLAVWVKDIAARQEDVAEKLMGPSVKVAYKDGVATPAAGGGWEKGGGGGGGAGRGEESQGGGSGGEGGEGGRGGAGGEGG